MTIPVFDYRRDLEKHRSLFNEAIIRVLNSGQLILGPEVAAFEREYAAFHRAKFAIGVNSGTDALILALRVMGIGVGHEVITVPNTAVPTVSAIRATGARVRFVDVDPDTLLMDLDQLPGLVNQDTRAIIAVHLFGNALDVEWLSAFCKKHRLLLIEDCAQADGAKFKGISVGTFGDIGCFSFYPTKNLGAFGDGGLCLTQDSSIADRLRMQRMYGFRGDGHAHVEGVNSRLDEIQAAVLRVKLVYLQNQVERRRAIASSYRERLGAIPGLIIPAQNPHADHAYHLFPVRTLRREAFLKALSDAKIGYGIHYPTPIHLMEAYQYLGYKVGSFPVAERAAQELVSLPMFPELTDVEVDRVCNAIVKAMKS